ncbi:Membrane primary amine oxidase [Pelobates cultripes]|uniref:Amine oxidase n=1 Tax=Pelobates cultripes TaxID=61616 RepID=A0AAD1WFB4_PELCU|nr:Membrane primary amine oxidase [Pelobates cultripes]
MNIKSITLTAFLVAVGTIVALVAFFLVGPKLKRCVLKKEISSQLKHNEKSLVFADLTPEEINEVMDYLKKNLKVDLVDVSKANPDNNCIYSVVLQLPKKQDVLLYLDKSGAKPRREALAVVYLGKETNPEVKEFVVGPLPNPTYIKDVTIEKYHSQIPYYRRPALGKEFGQIEDHITKVDFPKAQTFLKDVFGYNDYESGFFSFLTSAPRGYKSGDRNTWFVVFFNNQGSGFYLHPVGLEILVNHKNLDVKKWSVEKVFYNGRFFEGMEELETQYLAGTLTVVKMRKPLLKDDFASLKPPKSSVSDIPRQYEPQGPRYSVKNNNILFQHWSLAFGADANSGLRLYDIRFKDERIVYELSVQEAISVYGSNAPGGMLTRYMDGSFGIGRFMFQLVRGIDCPYSASYVDTFYLLDSDSWIRNKDSICIFEFNSGLPLRRHFSSLGSFYYGGLTNTVLVVRSIATLGNYDYVFDFIFYQNGAIESKVHATGYISTSFYMEGGTNYGNRVGPNTLGTIHTHFINYKVDLDVGGKLMLSKTSSCEL